jgi:hypothetical protein
MLVGCSVRRRVLTEQRQFVTDYLLFGRLCWWRRRWQVIEGDFLAALAVDQQAPVMGIPDFQFWHALFVYRSGRRRMFAFGMYAHDRVVPGMEHRVARLVDMPYEGYREPKRCWLSG